MSRKPWRDYGRYGSVGLELILSIGLGYYLGKWADDHFHARGWLTGLGFLVGCYTGFKALWNVSKKMQRDIERTEKMERGEDPWDDDVPMPDDARSADDAPRTPDAAETDDEKPRDEPTDQSHDDSKK